MSVVAVTTRSRLRGLRFLPPMLLATLRIRRQLARTDGVLRWASVIAGPGEFWTLTVWSSRHAMQEFMRSGAHGDLMWLFSRWLRSFWLARWRPGPRELGSWDGLTLRQHAGEVEQDPVLERLGALGGGEDVRIPRVSLERAGGAVVRLPLSPHALAELVSLRRRLRSDPRLLGVATGLGNRRDLFLFAVWNDRDGAAELVGGTWARGATRRYGRRFWAHEWQAENEFGHWDRRRLRVTARPRGARGSAAEQRDAGRPPPRARARRRRGR